MISVVACAVFAYQCVDFPRIKLKIDAFEGMHAGKTLVDAAHLSTGPNKSFAITTPSSTGQGASSGALLCGNRQIYGNDNYNPPDNVMPEGRNIQQH